MNYKVVLVLLVLVLVVFSAVIIYEDKPNKEILIRVMRLGDKFGEIKFKHGMV